ncbi:MAG: CehA/McbA family metallohydrolase [Planctomycetes bacterium]|nr:CehA/McbA family metallohydrolase [Planctomycetota bacterium]
MELTNPYSGLGGRWLKCALHVHTINSDGSQHPHEVVRDYRARGFDVVALTDHNAVPTAEQMAVPDCDAIVLPGCEYRGNRDSELGVIGVRAALPLGQDVRQCLDAAVESGGFVVYNHPTWHIHHWPIWYMLKLRTAHALEVYNAVVEWLPGPAECTDKWDRLLTSGYRVHGIATDDAHHPDQRDKGWVMVDSARQAPAVVEALKAGRFYSSTGVVVRDIRLEGGRLTVESENAGEIRFYADRGCVRSRQEGPSATYEIGEADIFVRAELLGCGGRKAWTNAIFVETPRSRQLSDEFRTWYLKQQAALAEI